MPCKRSSQLSYTPFHKVGLLPFGSGGKYRLSIDLANPRFYRSVQGRMRTRLRKVPQSFSKAMTAHPEEKGTVTTDVLPRCNWRPCKS